MLKKLVSQEGLKVLACVTMLLDHLGAVLIPGAGLRVIGRLSFPIYCFLVSEGIAHTRNAHRYCFRMLLGACLAEIPFDLLFFHRLTWQHQNVMITLLIGAEMLNWVKKRGKIAVPLIVCFFLAEFCQSDYGGWGVMLIALFHLTTDRSGDGLLQLLGMTAIFLAMESWRIPVGDRWIPIQVFGVFALIPIWCYSGKKRSHDQLVQIIFYLFYPVHLVILLLYRSIVRG